MAGRSSTNSAKRFTKDKLTNRLVTTMLTMFLPLIVLLIASHIAVHISSAKMNAKVQTLRALQHQVSLAELGLTEEESGQRGYDLTGSTALLTSFNNGTKDFQAATTKINTLIQSNTAPLEVKSKVQQMLQDGQVWREKYGVPQVNTKKASHAVSTANLQKGQKQFSKFMLAATQVLQHIRLRESHEERKFMLLTHLLWGLVEISSILISVVIFILSIRKVQSMVRPITELTDAVSAYSNEDFEVPVPTVPGNDEIKSLVAGVDKMRKSLKQHFNQMQSERISLFDNSPKILFRLSSSGKLLEVSQAASRTLGYNRDELLGAHFVSILNRFSRKMAVSAFRSTLKGAAQKNIELNIAARDGQICTFNVTMLPIQVDGAIVEVYGIAEDITEIKRMQSFVDKADKLNTVGELAAGIAHEIRNPLTVVQGFVQLMKSQQQYDERYITTIASETDRMKAIISEFMLLAKPPRAELKPVNLRGLLEDVVGLLNTQAIMKNIGIFLNLESESVVKCAPDQLKQVFINLLKNSIEAIDKEGVGKILILLYERENKSVVIRFGDNGCGIPEDKIMKLGEPFYTTKEDGNGLGLMICYRIIEQHNGTMAVQSELGKGTTIDVTLPKFMANKEESDAAYAYGG